MKISMRTLIDDVRWMYFGSHLYEMANMQPRDTGLVSIVHIMHKGNCKHGPRVKVSNVAGTFSEDNFTVTAEHHPRIIGTCKLKTEHLESIKDWIKLNHDHIHKVWHHGDIMSPEEVGSGFRRQ